RIRFRNVETCYPKMVQTLQGEWHEIRACEDHRLEVDHPFGTYTIEQLEYAATELRDADAAYILAERFASENWRDRRSDAHGWYMKAFLLSPDSEVYQRMMIEMGLTGGVIRRNGELDVANLAGNYTMLKVGQLFGVVEDRQLAFLVSAGAESDLIDFGQLDRNATEIYETLLSVRETM
ncbi:MAG: hypothetical protein AAGJ86_12370, partial [Pseudomonadota bacterium]